MMPTLELILIEDAADRKWPSARVISIRRLPWQIGQRVRFHDPETPRPLAEQRRGTVIGLCVYVEQDGSLSFGGVQVHWDGDTGIDDYVTNRRGQLPGHPP